VVAVSRFGERAGRDWFEDRGIETVAADLLDRNCLEALPEAKDILYLVGLKFGTSRNPALTWAANTLGPAHAAERYRGGRFVALSTGNVYPLTTVEGGGSREEDALTPVGEYANAALARERIFDYFSRREHREGIAVAMMRLNYATDLRYGVPVELARKVWEGEPVDLASGYFNCIWQGDASEMILRSFALSGSPACAWNLTAPAILRVREVAERLGELLGRGPRFRGTEPETALLNNPARLCAQLGAPPTGIETILRWTAHWVRTGGAAHGKPTHFEVRNGEY
jgi:nucleoside-diphosphate-sugar epimerase